jgi:AraC-like DNA-binding protein
VEEVGRANWGKYEQIVERARALIHKNIDRPEGSQPVSIEEVAALLHVSEGHLSRTFKRIAGVTFERYVIEKRIERARKLLLDPSSRVSEVADRCDFCNPAYFSRIFRKIVGCTPTEFSKHPTLHQATAAAISQPGSKEEFSSRDTAIPFQKTSLMVTEPAGSELLG